MSNNQTNIPPQPTVVLSKNAPDLSQYREEYMDFLLDLLKIPSEKGTPTKTAPFGKETKDALDFFLEHAKKLGFRTKEIDGYAGYAEFGPEDKPSVGMVCHLDVVPKGDWNEAYHPKIEHGMLYARGCSDDKGPAVMALYAMKYWLDKGYKPNHLIRLIVGLDEESGSACLKYYNTKEKPPVACFTPDADFPVIQAEKGMMNVSITMPATTMPTLDNNTTLIEVKGGTKANVIPSRTFIKLKKDNKEETIEIMGKQGHASHPEDGINSISLALKKLGEMGFTCPLLSAFNSLIGEETNGKSLGIYSIDEPSGELTLNIGTINWSNEGASFIIDVRYPVTSDAQQIEHAFIEKFKSYGLTATITMHSKPLYLPETHPLIATLLSTYNDLTGQTAKPIGIGGGTYARSLANTVAFGGVFPNQPVQMHQTGESISLDLLEKSGSIYAEAIVRLDQQSFE